MTQEEFVRRQEALGWTNKQVAYHCRRSEQTVSNWRNQRQVIPDYVELLLDIARDRQRAERSEL